MLDAKDTVLVVVDVQARLAPVMHAAVELIDGLSRLIRGAAVLELPVIWTEQNPAGLGPTVPELAGLLPGHAVAKMSFSCCREPAFLDALDGLGRNSILLAGIESHVCVYQTARDLLATGHVVEVAADAVSSRKASNKAIALARLAQAGAAVTCVETALFELLGVAEGPKFKQVLAIVK